MDKDIAFLKYKMQKDLSPHIISNTRQIYGDISMSSFRILNKFAVIKIYKYLLMFNEIDVLIISCFYTFKTDICKITSIHKTLYIGIYQKF